MAQSPTFKTGGKGTLTNGKRAPNGANLGGSVVPGQTANDVAAGFSERHRQADIDMARGSMGGSDPSAGAPVTPKVNP